ncbi:hypothetical protein C4544_01495 [candidate division WS5 bacterium]|uniref:ArsR family transcriptional regulator n=1 Tax=candidate division WS5 bacterium TaxID=2093353 RepID=A0A419DFS8_9BACT|nr:MAG: hypothetical protein C4544_01495 [candidate division WS5 bacterium]
MGTKKISTMILETLLEEPKTLSDIKRSLVASGMRCENDELEKSILRLGRQGYLKVLDDRVVRYYCITALGQAVSENLKK